MMILRVMVVVGSSLASTSYELIVIGLDLAV